MKYADVSDAEFPIIRVRLNPVSPTVEQIHEFFDEIEAICDRTSGAYVSITDASAVNWMSGKARVTLGRRANEMVEKNKTRTLGAVIILSSLISRTMFQGLNLIMKHPAPQFVVKDMEEAYAKAQELLTEHQQPA